MYGTPVLDKLHFFRLTALENVKTVV